MPSLLDILPVEVNFAGAIPTLKFNIDRARLNNVMDKIIRGLITISKRKGSRRILRTEFWSACALR